MSATRKVQRTREREWAIDSHSATLTEHSTHSTTTTTKNGRATNGRLFFLFVVVHVLSGNKNYWSIILVKLIIAHIKPHTTTQRTNSHRQGSATTNYFECSEKISEIREKSFINWIYERIFICLNSIMDLRREIERKIVEIADRTWSRSLNVYRKSKYSTASQSQIENWYRFSFLSNMMHHKRIRF